MYKAFFVMLALALVPAGALAASPVRNLISNGASAPSSFSAARSLVVASTSAGNAYATGASVVVTAPVAGDLTALGGSVVTATPVAGDALLLGGSISSRAPVAGDVRAVGWSIDVAELVGSDLVALGYSVHDSGRAKGSVFIVAANAVLTDGASGPVTIYGNNVSLAGNFAGDVNVVTSGHFTLAASTTILGTLSYQAPETVVILPSVTILGGVQYTSVSYLPSSDTSHILELMSIGFFLVVRVLGALILAGLLAGLFPRLAQTLVGSAYTGRLRSHLLTTLLGFAILVATPILFILLMLTFVGIGLGLLVLGAYALIALLSFVYAGILLGGVLMRRFAQREAVLWHDGVLGMLALSLISLVPFIGTFVVLLLAMFCAGALLLLFFHYAFPHEEHTSEML